MSQLFRIDKSLQALQAAAFMITTLPSTTLSKRGNFSTDKQIKE
jgi:hypothetical protein